MSAWRDRFLTVGQSVMTDKSVAPNLATPKSAENLDFLQSVQTVQSVTEAEKEKAFEDEERRAIQEEPPARPNPKHREYLAALISVSRQRPPSWADPTSFPPPGAWCGCCSRHDQTKRGRWWMERKDPKGWRCWACHPPALTEAEVAEVRT